MKHLQEAFVEDIFQSYFDHKATLLDTDHTVMLTGQAMALLNRIASHEQAVKLANKTKKVLFDAALGGYKLNSLYDQEKHGLGRAFYFAYGHKENGAVFSHMAMMYSYGLYNYQLNELADEAWTSILYQSMKDYAQVYEGIPEYFNDEGKGKYLYLTGSASWLLFILRKQVFGLNFKFGQLFLEPKLVSTDFIEGKASIHTMIFGQKTTIHYHLETPTNHYQIKSIFANKKALQLPITTHYPEIDVYLGE
jgi:cellobiose phosphorylase